MDARLPVRILSTGFANPPDVYTQKTLRDLFICGDNAKLRRFFDHPHIETRHLVLPAKSPNGRPIEESTGDLLEKFTREALRMGRKAVGATLEGAALSPGDLDFLCCVTSTGFIVPGLSARLVRELGLRVDIQRADIVGMGCHGGVNGLNIASSWALANPGKNSLLLCCEVSSAIYSLDETPRTTLVNSLFGDGAAAVLLQAGPPSPRRGPPVQVLGFASHIIPEHAQALRFDWDNIKHRYSFYIDPATPEILAMNVENPLNRILENFSLKSDDVSHWIMHTGGAAILDRLQSHLRLEPHQLRHTREVLRKFGNLSSGSFLFTYDLLIKEGSARPGDYGVIMAMGPGLSIELALLKWLT